MTQMSRRGFLGLLAGAGGAAAAHVLDLERLLWVPGAKTIVLPPVEGWATGHSFVTADWVAREALRVLEKNLTFAAVINRQYDDRFTSVSGVSLRVR